MVQFTNHIEIMNEVISLVSNDFKGSSKQDLKEIIKALEILYDEQLVRKLNQRAIDAESKLEKLKESNKKLEGEIINKNMYIRLLEKKCERRTRALIEILEE